MKQRPRRLKGDTLCWRLVTRLAGTHRAAGTNPDRFKTTT